MNEYTSKDGAYLRFVRCVNGIKSCLRIPREYSVKVGDQALLENTKLGPEWCYEGVFVSASR